MADTQVLQRWNRGPELVQMLAQVILLDPNSLVIFLQSTNTSNNNNKKHKYWKYFPKNVEKLEHK